MKDKPLVSACIITHREIKQTLNSIVDLVDELVIVCSNREIAEAMKNDPWIKHAWRQLTISYREWTGDFSAARMDSLKLATGEWILYIDSDEWIVYEEGCSADQLRTALMETDENAFWIPFRNWMNRTKTSSSPGRMMRIFRRKGASFEEPVQNALMGFPVGAQMAGLHIEHDGYDSPEKMRQKSIERAPIYEKLLEREDADENWHTWYHYAKNCWFMGDIPKCMDACDKAIDLLTRAGLLNEQNPYVDIYRVKAVCERAMGMFHRADNTLVDGALCSCPRYSDAYYELYLLHGLMADHYHKCWQTEQAFRKESGAIPAYDIIHVKEVEYVADPKD